MRLPIWDILPRDVVRQQRNSNSNIHHPSRTTTTTTLLPPPLSQRRLPPSKDPCNGHSICRPRVRRRFKSSTKRNDLLTANVTATRATTTTILLHQAAKNQQHLGRPPGWNWPFQCRFTKLETMEVLTPRRWQRCRCRRRLPKRTAANCGDPPKNATTTERIVIPVPAVAAAGAPAIKRPHHLHPVPEHPCQWPTTRTRKMVPASRRQNQP